MSDRDKAVQILAKLAKISRSIALFCEVEDIQYGCTPAMLDLYYNVLCKRESDAELNLAIAETKIELLVRDNPHILEA